MKRNDKKKKTPTECIRKKESKLIGQRWAQYLFTYNLTLASDDFQFNKRIVVGFNATWHIKFE